MEGLGRTYLTVELTEQEISNLIMGSALDTSIMKQKGTFGDLALQVENVSYTDDAGVEVVRNVSFGVRKE